MNNQQPTIQSSPAVTPAGGDVLLRLEAISKSYPGVNALAGIDFELKSGEVHILFGENGAGKSTLISLISGAQRPSTGRMLLHGQAVDLASVHSAREHGISAVFQEFSLIPQLTVEENIFLGHEITRGLLLDKKELHRRSVEILDRLGFDLKADARVASLSRADRQMVEIAKAFTSPPSVLILDEPTASLTERETDRLFALVNAAKKSGTGIIYITHRMGEIRRIGDRITILRDGRKVATHDVADVDDEKLVELMTGRVITQVFPRIAFRPAETRLEVRNMTTAGNAVRDVSISVRAGEVVGIAGLVGSGKGEVGRACFGLETVVSGSIHLNGENVTGKSVMQMLKSGLFYLPSDRREEGLILVRGAKENISLAALDDRSFTRFGFLRRAEETKRTLELARHVELRPLNLDRHLEQFSGGNQQKVMIAKALSREVDLFIFDEPTVGVDVGTRVAIYGFIRDLCEAGAGVLLISSDLPEILHLTNRTYVMYRGELRVEVHR